MIFKLYFQLKLPLLKDDVIRFVLKGFYKRMRRQKVKLNYFQENMFSLTYNSIKFFFFMTVRIAAFAQIKEVNLFKM